MPRIDQSALPGKNKTRMQQNRNSTKWKAEKYSHVKVKRTYNNTKN